MAYFLGHPVCALTTLHVYYVALLRYHHHHRHHHIVSFSWILLLFVHDHVSVNEF